MTIAIFWLLFAVAAVGPLEWTIYLFFVALSFGSVTVVPGSTTILPYVALAPLFIGKVLIAKGNRARLWDAVLHIDRLGLLTAFVLLAFLVTLTAPFMFEGIVVMGINSPRLTPLRFGAGNLTQPLYLLISYALCVSFYTLMLSDSGRRTLATGLLIGGVVALLSGIIDIATAGTAILAPLRTATYVIFEGAMVGDARRVIGFNTEASSFGALTLSFAAILVFIQPANFLGARARLVQGIVALGLLLMAALSTSSAAYLGLAILASLYFVFVLSMVVMPASRMDRRSGALTVVALAGTALILAAIVISRTELYDQAAEMVDMVLFQKEGSDSFNERSSWNRASMKGFAASGGYGVGVGSTRASSWPVAVLSSTGILGAALMIAFVLKCLLKRLPAGMPAVSRAAAGARYAFVTLLIPVSFAGTLVDFGVFMALFFALMSAGPAVLRPPSWQRDTGRA